MMIHRLIPLFAALASPAASEVVPMSYVSMNDGPYIEMPEDVALDMSPTSYEDIVTMANLDNDPSVITEEEQEMIAVLTQVLGATPISY